METIAVVMMQMDIVFGQPQKNYGHVQRLFSQASLKGGEIVVLPEMWNTAYDLTRLAEISDNEGEQTKAFLAHLAQEYQVNIIGGSIARRSGKDYYNTTYIFDRQGNASAAYDKVHLFRLMNEERYLRAGDKLVRQEIQGISFGLAICYDLRFPELFRKLSTDGAKVLVIPAQWPTTRIEHWKKLLQARAIENQAFVIGVNRVGSDPNNLFGGNSMVINPLGQILLELGESETVGKAELDLESVSRTRKEIPVFEDRRPELY